MGAELLRVRHAAVALASAVLRAANATAPPASLPAAAPRLGAAAAGASEADFERGLSAALRFSFRVHQFAGGFDEDAAQLFRQLAARLAAMAQLRADGGVAA